MAVETAAALNILHVPKLLTPERMMIKINNNHCKWTKAFTYIPYNGGTIEFMCVFEHKNSSQSIPHQNRMNSLHCCYKLEVKIWRILCVDKRFWTVRKMWIVWLSCCYTINPGWKKYGCARTRWDLSIPWLKWWIPFTANYQSKQIFRSMFNMVNLSYRNRRACVSVWLALCIRWIKLIEKWKDMSCKWIASNNKYNQITLYVWIQRHGKINMRATISHRIYETYRKREHHTYTHLHATWSRTMNFTCE